MRPNGSSRTPFDDDLVDNLGAPKDTQPLPAQPAQSPQTPRPSRLLPPQPGPAPTPMAGAAHNAPPGPLPTIGSVPANVPTAVPNDTSRLSLKRTPLSTIIGFSVAGGALAVMLISAVIGRAVHRTLTVADHPAQGTGTSVVVPPGAASNPVPVPAEDAPNTTPDNTVVMPNQNAPVDATNSDSTEIQSTTTKTRKTKRVEKDTPPASNDSTDQAADDTARAAQGDNRSASVDSSSDAQDDTGGNAPMKRRMAAAPPRDNNDEQDNGSAAGSSAASQRFVHSRIGYAVTPPPGFKLVKRGQRTIWSGPDGTSFLVETTNRPGRSPFGDWLRLDASLRKKYGTRYTSRGIEQTTIAGHPAAIWDFDLVTDKGTVRKIDIGIHANGKGYALLGSAPAAQFDQVRPQLEQAIKSFEVTKTGGLSGSSRRHRRHHSDSSEAAQSTDSGSSDSSNSDSSDTQKTPSEDMRPDIGY